MFSLRLLRMPTKAFVFFLLFFILILGLLSTHASAAADNKTISVLIDGKVQNYEQPPLIDNGHTLVPLRAIFEALGAEIKWNSYTNTAIAIKGNIEIIISIGVNTAYVNGQPQLLDVSAQIINGHTMVPLRFISQAFGAHVNWRSETQTVSIKTTIITLENSSLKMPIKSTDASSLEVVKESNEIPKQEEAAHLSAPLNPPIGIPMVSVPLTDLKRDWKSYDTRHFKIYYYEQEQDIFTQSQFYDNIYEALIKEFGHPLPERIPVYYYNDADYLLDKEIPSWSVAAWVPSTQSMRIKLEAKMNNDQSLMSFRHELTHAITISSIDSAIYDVPSWFYEGVATYFEQAQPYYDLGRSSVLYKAFQNNKIIDLSAIAADSKNWAKDDVGLIYAEAQSFYGYLVDHYGETNANEIYYTAGSFSAVLQQVTNNSLSTLENNWKIALSQSYTTAKTVSGRIYFAEGAWYEGNIKNGLQDGQGKLYMNDKLVYSGGYKEGKFEGQGVLFYSSGSVYKGLMKADKPNGQGKYYWLEGDRYDGNMLDGQFEGQGTYYWKNGNAYVGEWKAGKQNGQGVIRRADGTSQSGFFRDGEMK